MELKKKFKKIGFIFGLKREMDLVSDKNKFCTYGYGELSKEATNSLLKNGVDIVINFGFSGSISKDLKNGDIVFVNKIFNERKQILPTFKFHKNLLPNLDSKFKIFKCNLLTVKKIAGNKKQKRNLAKKFSSVSAIDMEAYHIKKELLKHNIPMISMKVIFDDLSFDIPSYLKDCINEKGDLRIKVFLMKLMMNPKRIMGLLSLHTKFSKSRRVLEGLINAL